jgi:hypothetical protein
MVTSIKSDFTTLAAPSGDEPRILDHFRTYITNISAARAQTILDTLNWPRQRDRNERWVEVLRLAILKGELTFLTLAYAELPNGRQYLLDGQHRLDALSRIEGRALPAQVTVHRVNDEAAVGALYLTYDRPKVRTPDVGLRAMGVFDQTETPEMVVKRLSPGALLAHSGFSRSIRTQGVSTTERSRIVQSWLPEIDEYYRLLIEADAPTATKRLLMRSPVAAVALVTMREQPMVAQSFWSKTASQEMLETNDPRRTLLLWLQQTTVFRGRQGMSEVTYCLYIANAWNAFFEGRPLKILKVASSQAAMRLAGTRYQGSAQ